MFLRVRRFSFLSACCLGLLACTGYETKKVPASSILEEELKQLDLKEVDTYPAFTSCDSTEGRQATKACFEQIITANFYDYLGSKTLVVPESIRDTVWVRLAIDQQGTPAFLTMRAEQRTTMYFPELEGWLKASLDSLPQVHPATKRGIPVTATFRVPIILQAD
ncbi:hypothetical protein [Croceiramulus getboli]|nr:hypothetical protein P8624_06670 [Flavobacteriaceae bacterium YJPT1-3]